MKIDKKPRISAERHQFRLCSTVDTVQAATPPALRPLPLHSVAAPAQHSGNTLDSTCSREDCSPKYDSDTSEFLRSWHGKVAMLSSCLRHHRRTLPNGAEQTFELHAQRSERGVCRTRFRSDYDIAIRGQFILIQAKKHTKASFYRIPGHCISHCLGNRQP